MAVGSSGSSSALSTLDAAFPAFAKLSQGGLSTQSTNGPGGMGGRDPRLASLDAAIVQAGIAPASALTPAGFDIGGLLTGAGQAIGQAIGGRSGGQIGGQVGGFLGGIGRSFGLFADATEPEMAFLEGFLKGQVQDLITKLYQYVNQYSQLVECVPLVTTTVNQFGAGQYAKALTSGYQAYSCIKSKL